MIKKLLIGLGIVLLTAGAVFGILYLVRDQLPKAPAEETPSTTATVYDTSKDYGACTMIESTTIKNSLGDTAKDLQDPVNMGVVSNRALGDEVKDLVSDSQFCVFPFVAGGTIDNGYNSDNALSIERVIYTNETGPETLIDQIKTAGLATTVESLGIAAFYSSNTTATGPGAGRTFTLEVFTKTTSVRYMLREPAATGKLTEATAKSALVDIAKSAKVPN